MTSLDIHQILETLPHRFPMLLVDRVLECEAGKRIKAVKNVTINEPFFPGHYPHSPVMPGVLVIESMAQTAAILTFITMNAKPDPQSVYYFVGIDDARFKKPVMPGDQMILEVELTRSMRGMWKYAATATVDGALCAEAELMTSYRINALAK
jgi:3-hydroxyacyl-[acyl-carrier-protein] dehydratase